MEHESDGDTYCNWCSWYSHQRIATGTGVLGNKRVSGDYSFIKIDQNSEKSPGDLRRLAVTQTPVRNHQLMLMRKTNNNNNNNNNNKKKKKKKKKAVEREGDCDTNCK